MERATSILAAFRSSQKDFLDISIFAAAFFLSQSFEVTASGIQYLLL
jgi:hypothetical protein